MAFWKPGTIAPGSEIDRESVIERENANIVPYHSRTELTLQQQRMRLPIYKIREREIGREGDLIMEEEALFRILSAIYMIGKELLYAVETYRVVIIVGQTGSGKTTQIPQYLHEAGWTSGYRIVCCTQVKKKDHSILEKTTRMIH
jgi:ATP-dependent RNA helicase DDX35